MSDGRRSPPRRVLFRQCDLERAIRAAQATGAGRVMVTADGAILIDPEPLDDATLRRGRLAKIKEVVFS